MPACTQICTLVLLVCITVSCLIPVAHAENVIPALPAEYYGNISIHGILAPAGTVIGAYINGEERGNLTTMVQGRYGGLSVFEPRLMVSGSEDDRGLPVTFRVNDMVTNESSIFYDGHSTRLDLTVLIPGPTPGASFTVNRSFGLLPVTILFTDTSDSVNTTSRVWTFGDGNGSSIKDPVYVYRKAGNYTATLTISNSTGSNTTVPGQHMTIYPKGDFNHNWEVDIGDVALVAYIVVGRAPAQIPDADFNNNGEVDIGDAAKIAWFVVGKVPEL